ncbi:unnamed protein product [Rhizoctonia solani]|nr:unnamed protein product [Rhizoctonia solani]
MNSTSDSPGGTPVLPLTETSALSTPNERQLRRNGHLGHLMRPETSISASNWNSASFSLSLPSIVANIPPQPPGAPSSLQYEPRVHMMSPQAPMSTSQGSALVSSLLAPTGGLRTAIVYGPLSDLQGGPNLVTQTQSKPPRVKAYLLSTGGRNLPVLQDAGLAMQGLGRVRNLDPTNVVTRVGKMIDYTFDSFFDPADIRKGGLLILIISGHGERAYGDGVSLQFQTQDGTPINSNMLQQKIMALPNHCTLEVIVDTCFAEDVIPGLRRVLTTEPSTLPTFPTGMPHLIATATPPSDSAARSKYNAKVVVWAASTKWGYAYPEADLPGKPGVCSIMIGAIFRQLISNGPNVTRQHIWESALKTLKEQNDARSERDLRKPPRVRASLIQENRIQRPVLLTSVEDPVRP